MKKPFASTRCETCDCDAYCVVEARARFYEQINKLVAEAVNPDGVWKDSCHVAKPTALPSHGAHREPR